MSAPLRRTGGRNHSVFTCRRLEPEWFFQYEYVLASVSQSELGARVGKPGPGHGGGGGIKCSAGCGGGLQVAGSAADVTT